MMVAAGNNPNSAIAVVALAVVPPTRDPNQRPTTTPASQPAVIVFVDGFGHVRLIN